MVGNTGAFILTGAGQEQGVALVAVPRGWRRRPAPRGLRLRAAHYLPGCRYWCTNMLSSLSIQPPLFLQGEGDFAVVTADNG